MQTRYKINTSAEARKSSTNPTQTYKNDSLSYINLLDKCTQILRQDRIWIRNQLKANDEEIYKIFKQAKRPINLQHLQIRLRKHVTAVKSKAKMEQLMKFKQNMHMGDWMPTEEKSTTIPKKQSTTKYQLPTNLQSNSSEFRGLKARMNNSVDKNPKPSNGIYPYRNTSANCKKIPEPYPAPMEQITERQSQNMTSARNRVFGEDSNQEIFALSHNYQQWRRPEVQTNITPSNNSSNYIQDPFKPKAQASYFNNFIEEEKKPIKPVVAQKNKYQPPAVQSRSPVSSSSKAVKAQTNMSSQYNHNKSHVETSKMKKETQQQHHESYSPQVLNRRDYTNSSNIHEDPKYEYSQENGSNSKIISNSYLQEYSPNAYKPQNQHQAASSTNFLDSLNANSRVFDRLKFPEENYQREYSYTQQTFKNQLTRPLSTINNLEETDLLHSKNSIIPFSSNSNSDSLFTSPQLLAECRNFLKLKSSAKPSVQKQFTNSRLSVDKETKFQPLKFENFQPLKTDIAHGDLKREANSNNYSNSESSMMQMLNEINCGMAQSISQQHETFNYQQSTSSYSYPVSMPQSQPQLPLLKYEYQRVQKQAPKQMPKQYLPDKNEGLHEYFHTFAGLSSHKKVEQIQIATPEAFVDLVFENLSGEPEGFVYWLTLEKLVERKSPQFKDSFKQYLYPTDEQKLVLISNIGRLLEDLMPQNRLQQSENDARNIYRLLDIEQKGYIVQQDIEDFIHQLQDSQASDIEMISEYIWKLFETIDEDAEEGEAKRIDYWGIYSKKHSIEFQQLNQILKQFQFQIE